MAIDHKKSYEVSENGITIDSGTGIWIGGGDAAPTHNAPEGSRYFRTSPEEEYVQEGPGETNNWVQATSSPKGKGVGGVKVNFWVDGSAKNKWLQRDNNHSQPSGPSSNSDAEPWISPYDGEINALSFINKNDSVDTDVEIYKNGTLAFTWQVRTKKWATNSNFTAVSISAGDKISVFLRDRGVDGDDALVDLFIAFNSDTAQELGGATL